MQDPNQKPENTEPEENSNEDNMQTFVGGFEPPKSADSELEDNMQTFIGTPAPAEPPLADALKTIVDVPSTEPSDAVETPPIEAQPPETPPLARTVPFQTDPPEPLAETVRDTSASTPSNSAPDAPPPATEAPPAPEQPKFDPHATQFQQMEAQQPKFDPHATQFQQVQTQEPKTDLHSTQGQSIPSTPPATASYPQVKPTAADAPTATPQPTREQPRRKPKTQAEPSGAVKNLGALPLWGIFISLILFSGLGLALFVRMIVLILVFTEFNIIAIVLGILGVGLFALPVIVLEMVPPLAGLKTRLDSLTENAPIVEEPRAPKGALGIGLAVMIVLVTLLGALFATDPTPVLNVSGSDDFVENTETGFNESLEESSYREISPVKGKSEFDGNSFSASYPLMPMVLILGLLGAGGLVASAMMDFSLPKIAALEKLPINITQLLRPFVAGFGVIAFALALALVGHRSGDFILYVVLALVGAYGIAGTSWQVLPQRFHTFATTVRIGIFSGIVAIGLMSLITMFVDASSVEGANLEDFTDSFKQTYRFAFSPDYFLYTVADRNIVVMSIMSIFIIVMGIAGLGFTLQVFGNDIRADKEARKSFIGVASLAMVVAMVPALVLWPFISLIGLGRGVEVVFLWGLPFALLLTLVWVAQNRPQIIDSALKPIKSLLTKVPPAVPAPLRGSLNRLNNVSGQNFGQQMTWQVGFAVAVVFSFLALPLALSFWFWIIAAIGVLFVLGQQR